MLVLAIAALTLSLAAAKLPAYQKIIDDAVAFGKKKSEYVSVISAS